MVIQMRKLVLQQMHNSTIIIANSSDYYNCVDSEIRMTIVYNCDWAYWQRNYFVEVPAKYTAHRNASGAKWGNV